jgi:CubicO group peptidase (beta-lactamase class C family)
MRAVRSRTVHGLVLAVVAVALVAVFLQVRAVAGRTASGPGSARLDALFAKLVPDGQAGCAGAVYRDDGLLWTGARGFADVARRRLITDDTVFGIGHTSEQFTATAALLLAQHHRLALSDPLSRFLPGLPGWASTVHVRDLLRNTSGIPDEHRLLSGAPHHPVTSRALLAAVARTRLDFAPGAAGSTSGGDSVLLGLVVQAAAGRPLAGVLADEVFRPAGITAVLDRRPHGENVAESYQVPTDTAPYRDDGWMTVGDIGVHLTAKDLATWGAQYWRPTVGGPGLLKARLQVLRTDELGEVLPGTAPLPGEVDAGPGITVWADARRRLLVWAPGADGNGFGEDGFISDLIVIPHERLASAVLCNHQQPSRRLAGAIALELLQAVRGRMALPSGVDW